MDSARDAKGSPFHAGVDWSFLIGTCESIRRYGEFWKTALAESTALAPGCHSRWRNNFTASFLVASKRKRFQWRLLTRSTSMRCWTMRFASRNSASLRLLFRSSWLHESRKFFHASEIENSKRARVNASWGFALKESWIAEAGFEWLSGWSSGWCDFQSLGHWGVWKEIRIVQSLFKAKFL